MQTFGGAAGGALAAAAGGNFQYAPMGAAGRGRGRGRGGFHFQQMAREKQVFDGKRMRKAVVRKAVDYDPSVMTYLKVMVIFIKSSQAKNLRKSISNSNS